jgi:hypothetical protein
VEPRELTTPEEVAELRRVLQKTAEGDAPSQPLSAERES